MADRFFTPNPIPLGEFVLDGPEGHHLATVRRFALGDRVVLFNGDGHDYPAEVLSLGKKSAVLTVDPPIVVNREIGFKLVVASALPKGDRADFLIEKLTELGVTRFIPLITTRSVVVPKENVVEKFTRAVIEASKQCGRNVLMAIERPCRWNELIQRTNGSMVRYVLDTFHQVEPFRGDSKKRQDVLIAIGPEGGFTAEEVATSIQAEWQPVTLGPRVLRVETAALAAVARLTSD